MWGVAQTAHTAKCAPQLSWVPSEGRGTTYSHPRAQRCPLAPSAHTSSQQCTQYASGAYTHRRGIGVYFDSNITLTPSNVASTEIVDRRTPNSELCMAYGYSAMAFDQRLFVSFNP